MGFSLLNSLKAKLWLVSISLALLVLTPLALSWRILQSHEGDHDRAEIAEAILGEYLLLAEDALNLSLHMGQGGTLNDARGDQLTSAAFAHIQQARQLIATEVGVIGPGGAEEEREEFEWLDTLQAELVRATRGGSTEGWIDKVFKGVAEERRELLELDKHADETIDQAALQLLLLALMVLLIAIPSGIWLQRAVWAPARSLVDAARAVRAGDYSQRVATSGDMEVRELATVFNEMTEAIAQSTQDLRSDRQQLQQQIALRTQELASANERLASASERRSRFLADISHELRTPLGIIRGEAEVTLRSAAADAAQYRSSLALIADQVQGMARLVDDLLYIARSESGGLRLEMQAIGLRRLVEQAVGELRSMIKADKGQLELQLPSAKCLVLGDSDRLHQLLHILLDNAMRYTLDAPMIEVRLSVEGGGYILQVHDRGQGIPPDEIEGIFERFRRGRRAQERHGEGAGLGLPIAKSIAEGHGGRISAESEVGQGTVFKVFLPALNGDGIGA